MHIADQLKLFEQETIIEKKKKRGTDESDLIAEFVTEINKERPAGSFYIKNGKKVKLHPITYPAVLMKLYAIRNKRDELKDFLSECRRYKHIGKLEHDPTKTFSRRFYGGFLNTFQ